MPKIPFFRLGQAPEKPALPMLASSTPAISLEGLCLGVDNLRHDVVLSPRFVEGTRAHLARLVMRHGDLEGLLAAEAPATDTAPSWLKAQAAGARPKAEPADWKSLLAELHVAALNRAKNEGKIAVDLLARLAVIKFLRTELNSQFAQVLERCRIVLKSYEGMRHQKAHQYREQVAAFQVKKKIVLRKVGQELFLTLREIEKETLARTRRSLFGSGASDASGEAGQETYALLVNRLLFSEDGRDDYVCAEHYVMFGNWERDSDRFARMREIATAFLRSLYGEAEAGEEAVEGWLNVPQNANALVGSGTPDESTDEGEAQQERLAIWVRLLEDEQVMEHVIASYQVVPLLSEYAPRINAQQLKNALISRTECDRVERLIKDGGKLSPNSLYAAVGRVASCRGAERVKVAARFLRDFLRYHRDLRRLETLNAALDSISLVGNEKLRELSKVNGTLYEFLLPEEQQDSGEGKVLRHVVLKADVRDSTRLTRTMIEKDLNPASYFSLNFYQPVNKLLAKYGATKVFLEGDAIILAILEREGDPGLGVSRACVLAREILEIVRGYNALLQQSGLPAVELGVGISYQDSAPLYLMDGERQIMISEALNESDRLSSCHKGARKAIEPLAGPFHVYAFQSVSEADAGENAEEFTMSYNLSGIRMSAAAFAKLQQEIALAPLDLNLPVKLKPQESRLYRGLVPVGNGSFHKIVVRESRVPQVEARSFTFQKWTQRSCYEVCTDPAIYAALEGKKAAGNGG